MVELMFKKNEVYFIIEIFNLRIRYWDKLHGAIWDGPIQYLPKDPGAIQKVKLSRNRIPIYFIDVLNAPEEEYKQYQACKTDDELKALVMADALKNGCKLVSEK